MKPLYFSALFFLIFAVSHAFRFDINTNSDDHHDHDHSLVQSSSSSNGEDPLIRLPMDNKQPQLQTTSSMDHLTDVPIDLTELMNRRPVHLRNRFRFPVIRYIPRRCHHRFSLLPVRFSRFGPGVKVDPKDDMATIYKKQAAEVIRHRHVAGKVSEGGKIDAVLEPEFIIPLKRFHRRHHNHDHHYGEVDQTVEMKREEYVMKGEYEGEWKGDGHRHDHDHDHDHDHHHVHDHEEVHEEKESDIMKKIRKFLPHF